MSSNLSYENILHNYLDAEAVPVEDFLDDNGWVTGDRSDILIEEAEQKRMLTQDEDTMGTKINQYHNLLCTPN